MGAVVDYTNAYDQQIVVQDAMDSAALAAGKNIGLLTMSQLQEDVNNYYTANLGGRIEEPPQLATAVNASTITLTTDLSVPTYFLGVIGLDSIDFHLRSEATLALGTLEVAMVLDNSGSMSDHNNIATLREAATNLTNTLYNLGATSTKPDPVKVGLVPFAAAVNLGSQYAGASWMDTGGIAPYHADSMDGNTDNVNAFDLLDDMNNASWGGCVEMRPQPYDVSDDTPTTANSSTLFVPMFSPDAPDNWTCSSGGGGRHHHSGSSSGCSGAASGSVSYNNYLADDGGSCSYSGGTTSSNEADRYAATCKYHNEQPANITVAGIPGGPNFMCTTTSVTDLTTNQSDVTDGISAMQALGATNLQAGLMWGWRMLSPGAPFTNGRAYSVNDNQKILILMTDGFNTYYPQSNMLKSWYGAWGYVAQGHLGTTSTSQSYLIEKMNDRTKLACENAKAADVTVYTVSFQVSDADTLQMLSDCATDPTMAYISTSQSELLSAFHAIGDDISLLRISR